MKKITILILAFISILFSCKYDGKIWTEKREIRVDIQNLLFSPYENVMEDDPYFATDRGLDAKEVKIIVVTTNTSNAEQQFENTFNLEGDASEVLDPLYYYTPLVISDVEGTLKKVDVIIKNNDNISFTTELTKWTETDWYEGWETFENITKFRLVFTANSDDIKNSVINLEPAPRGGIGVALLWDNGQQAKENALTDRGRAGDLEIRASGKIAIQPCWLENPDGLEYEIYSLIVEEDLRSEFDPTCNRNGEYWDDAWLADWSISEITKGKTIAGKNYKLEPIKVSDSNGNESPKRFNAKNPLGDGKASYLFETESENVGKYLIYALRIVYPEDIAGNNRTTYARSQVVLIKIK